MSVIATDNFNRSAATLGANWTETGAGWSTNGTVANGDDPANDATATYSAGTFPNNQYAQAKCTVTGANGGDQGIGLQVRGDATAANLYRTVTDKKATLNVGLSKVSGGSYTNLWTRTSTHTDGDVLYIEAQSTTIIVKRNGTAIGASTTDSSVASGKAGIVFSAPETSVSVDDWEGGDFATSGSPVVGMQEPFQLDVALMR